MKYIARILPIILFATLLPHNASAQNFARRAAVQKQQTTAQTPARVGRQAPAARSAKRTSPGSQSKIQAPPRERSGAGKQKPPSQGSDFGKGGASKGGANKGGASKGGASKGDGLVGSSGKGPGRRPDRGSGGKTRPGKDGGYPDKGDDVGQDTGGRPDKGDDVGHDTGSDTGGYPDKGDVDHGDKPPRPERPPRRPRWPVVVIGPSFPSPGGDDQEAKKDKKKDKKEKQAKQEPADNLAKDELPAPPRALKYDKRAYRQLADALLSRGRIDAALRVLELLKEQEYYEYTGQFGEIASAEAVEGPADGGDGRTFAGLDIVRVKSSSKKKSKKADEETAAAPDEKGKKSKKSKDETAAVADEKGKKGKKDDVEDLTSTEWESRLEARADALLALQQESDRLSAIAPASRTAEQIQRLAQIDAEMATAARDLDLMMEALAADLGAKDPRVKRLRNAQKLATELVQAPGVVAAYTVSTEKRFWTVVLSPAGKTAYSSPVGSAELERKVFAFRDVLVNPKLDPIPLASEIYDTVVRPAERDASLAAATTVVWSFDGVLRYVPVSALYDGKQYLVERYRLAVFNRASIPVLLDTPNPQLEGVGFGVARKVGSFAPLPAVADELRAIFSDASVGSLEGAVPGKILLDTSFTEAAFEQALREGHSLVHVATHFQLSPGDAEDSLLLFGDGSLVNVGDIRDLKGGFKGVDLLTLSACNTAASGPGADGKEVECFATIAQERGAKAVLASLWPVSDRGTSELMKSFYRLRSSGGGVSKSELLRRAQLELIRGTGAGAPGGGAQRILVQVQPTSTATGPAYTPNPAAPLAHPFYWAPFVLVGNIR
jgi:CHAT domain-containing protein